MRTCLIRDIDVRVNMTERFLSGSILYQYLYRKYTYNQYGTASIKVSLASDIDQSRTILYRYVVLIK